MSAVFTAGQAAGAMFPPEALLIQIIELRLVSNAQAAVHSTGCNQYIFHKQLPPVFYFGYFFLRQYV